MNDYQDSAFNEILSQRSLANISGLSGVGQLLHYSPSSESLYASIGLGEASSFSTSQSELAYLPAMINFDQVAAELPPAIATEILPATAAEIFPAVAAEILPIIAAELPPAIAAETLPYVAAEVLPFVASEILPAASPASETLPTSFDDEGSVGVPAIAAELPSAIAAELPSAIAAVVPTSESLPTPVEDRASSTMIVVDRLSIIRHLLVDAVREGELAIEDAHEIHSKLAGPQAGSCKADSDIELSVNLLKESLSNLNTEHRQARPSLVQESDLRGLAADDLNRLIGSAVGFVPILPIEQ